MGIPVARLNDLCTFCCSCHHHTICGIGVCITGASTVIVNNQPVTRLTDLFACSCGHITAVVSTSNQTVKAENELIASIGDAVNCPPGTIITGSPNVFV